MFKIQSVFLTILFVAFMEIEGCVEYKETGSYTKTKMNSEISVENCASDKDKPHVESETKKYVECKSINLQASNEVGFSIPLKTIDLIRAEIASQYNYMDVNCYSKELARSVETSISPGHTLIITESVIQTWSTGDIYRKIFNSKQLAGEYEILTDAQLIINYEEVSCQK